jgi:hypothetical protein
MESGDPSEHRGHVGALGGAALVLLLRQMASGSIEDDEPQAVFPTERSRQLERLAVRLAEAEPGDPNAISQLQAWAGRHQKDLRRAAAQIRMHGLHHENRVDHVANNNLVAAATDGVFKSLTIQEDEWFSRIETLDDMPESESFEQLVTLQPALRDFERSVLRHAPALWPAATDPDEAIVDYVVKGLDGLVGPTVESNDPLVSTRLAHGICRVYLLRQIGVPLSD